MKKCMFTILAVLLCVTSVFAVTWTEKTSSPSYFPYETGTGNQRLMDLPIPPATNRLFMSYDEGSTSWIPTNMIIWSEADPRYGEQGYWPTYNSAAIYANGKYYVCAGTGPNQNLSGLNAINPDNGDVLPLGYYWPSNTYGYGYTYNRQSGFSIYNVAGDTWESAKWDVPTGLTGYPIQDSSDPAPGTYVNRQPIMDQGSWIGANQAFAFDWDSDGTEEIFMHGGYPHWDGYCAVFDQDEFSGQGGWTTTSPALNFSSGYKAQMYGGALRVESNIFVIGGRFWGPDGATHMQKYDPYTDTWTVYEDISTTYNLSRFSIAAVGTKIYMFSGNDGVNDYSPNIFMIDVANDTTIAEGLKVVGSVPVPVTYSSMISWKGVLYIVGGLTENGPTNTIQVFNPATESVIVMDDVLPVSAYGASCAVTPGGTFIFGGAMRMVDPVSGVLVNSSRLFTAPMPEQDIFIAPTLLDFWQTTDTLQMRIDNATGLDIVCTASTANAWLSFDPADGVVTVPGGSNVYMDVTVDRTGLSGPTTGAVHVVWNDKMNDTVVLLDTPRPDPVVAPTQLLTLVTATRSFTIENTGSTPMNFTNSSPDAFIASITPETGTIGTGETTTVSFDVTAAAPRPGTGTVEVAYNSYDGSSEIVTVVNNPGNYYVAPTGDDTNDGMSPATAWKTVAHGVNSIPEGDAINGPVTLNVAAGTYVDECTDAAGTNWIIDLTGRNYITVKGAGAERSFLTRETAVWNLTYDNDHRPNMPVIKLFNANNVRFTGFTIIATNPPARIDGDGDYPEMCGVIGIEGGSGVRVDHLLLDGTYHGQVYNELTAAWQASWDGWWFHAININGVIGTDDAMVDHVLTRGFVRSVYNNNFSVRGDSSNTNDVHIHYCTFVENIAPTSFAQAVTVRVADADFGPSFTVNNCIIGNMPNTNWPAAVGAEGLVASAMWSASNPEYTLLSRSNQFWQVGTVPPYNAFKNANVIDTMPPDYELTDYTNEVPDFITVGGIPYSTDIDSPYGYRDVGWNVVPEPVLITLLAAAAAFLLAARRR